MVIKENHFILKVRQVLKKEIGRLLCCSASFFLAPEAV
jgi:hypothetical protein